MTSVQLGLSAGLILASMGLVLFSIIFIAYKYVDAIEACLPNCSYVRDTKNVWENAGLLGKVMRGGIIAMIIMMPNIHARRGLIDTEEVENLPGRYKKLLVVPMVVGALLILCLIALRIASRLLEQ
ncbi:hypothetical protein [Pseudomonas sp. DWP3-1-2]|uniref:hypothetical protein n=1 Tax=Pseudomonas sp. DWP3-1-2 TaxID=2804645 RepID=UPI003CEFEE8B